MREFTLYVETSTPEPIVALVCADDAPTVRNMAKGWLARGTDVTGVSVHEQGKLLFSLKKPATCSLKV